MSRRVAILISAILLLGMAIPAVAKDEIRIVSVSPATTKPLRAGTAVPFEISLEYKIDRADYRQVRIEILRGSDGEPAEVLSRWTQLLPKGSSVLTIKRTVTIPETTRVTVVAAIEDGGYSGGMNKPAASDKKEYDVVDGAGQRIKPKDGGNTIKNYRLDQPQQPAPNGPPQITVDVASEKVDRIRIASISPSPEQSLRSGQEVDFEITVEYELTSTDIAELMMFFSRGLPIAQDNQVVQKGKDSVTVDPADGDSSWGFIRGACRAVATLYRKRQAQLHRRSLRLPTSRQENTDGKLALRKRQGRDELTPMQLAGYSIRVAFRL